MMSPDSVCHSFDERANGYAKSEGFGVVVLKRLSQAVHDGDTIRAVIRATGCNSDGRTPSITSPSQKAQEKLIRDTYQRAGLSLDATRFFEAHGTGTPVGDPCEASTISNVFSARTCTDPIYVGALKSNMGHSEGASGVAGVIKTILALEKGIIPPNVYDRVNPAIAATCANLKFPSTPVEWPTEDVRRASVNAFGYGGTNAHVVLDDALSFLESRGIQARHSTRRGGLRKRVDSFVSEDAGVQLSDNGPLEHHGETFPIRPSVITASKMLVLSAFDEGALQRSIAAHSEWLQSQLSINPSATNLSDVAHTLSQKRTSFPWKSFCVAGPQPSEAPTWSAPIRAKPRTQVCFVFTGQGAQWYGMGRELLRYPAFHSAMVDADNYFQALGSGWSLLDKLYQHANPPTELDSPGLSQPLCTALQVAMVDLLTSWNICPSTVIGHSSGEIAAAYAGGILSRESAWMIAYFRGLAVMITREIVKTTGAMVAVQATPGDLEPLLNHQNLTHPTDMVTIACYNSPANLTISGSRAAIDRLTRMLAERSIAHRILRVDVAYHSAHMSTVAAVYGKLLRCIDAGEQGCEHPRFVSTVTGHDLDDAAVLRTSAYWIENLSSPVQFSKAVMAVLADGVEGRQTADLIVEVGPHATLNSPLRDMLSASGRSSKADYCSVLYRGRSADLTALECAGKLYTRGFPVDIGQVNNEAVSAPKMLTSLPSYPFNDKTKYWLEGRSSKQYRAREHRSHELLGTRSDDWNPHEARWINRIVLDDYSYLKDHQVNGAVLLPAAGMLVMAIEAVRQLSAPGGTPVLGYQMKDVVFSNSITISPDANGTEVQLTLRPSNSPSAVASTSGLEPSWSSFSIFAYENSGWTMCCSGEIAVEHLRDRGGALEAAKYHCLSGEETKSHRHALKTCQVGVDSRSIYRAFEKAGLVYGPRFQALEHVRETRGSEATGMVNLQHWKLQNDDVPADPHLIHPAALDAILQLSFPAYSIHAKTASATTLPTGFKSLWISEGLATAQPNTKVTVHAKVAGRGFRNKMFAITAALAATEELCFHGQMETTTIGRGGAASAHAEEETMTKPLYKIEAKPDIDLLPQKTTRLDDAIHKDPSMQLRLFAHKYPHMRVLEVGAEPGARTTYILDAFENRLVNYVYTDAMSDFASQGFGDASIDMVVAPLQSKDAVQIQGQLRNCRNVLRRLGRLVLFVESSDSSAGISDNLDQTLIDAGFSGIDVHGQAHLNGTENAATAVVIATALSLPEPSCAPVHIIYDPFSVSQRNLLHVLRDTFSSKHDMESTAVSWDAVKERELQDATCIFLGGLDTPILENIREEDVQLLKRLITTAATLVWVSPNTHDIHRSPTESLVPGLVRTLATEAEEYRLVSLSLDVEQGTESMSAQIIKVARTFLQRQAVYEDEYVEVDGVLHIPRVVDDQDMSAHVAPQEQSTRTATKAWDELTGPRLSIKSAGHLNTLYFEQLPFDDGDLTPDDVLVEVKAAGVNNRDLLVALGQVHDEALGNDVAGIVRRVCETKAHGFKVGDRVFGVTRHGIAQVARCKAFQLRSVPDHMSFLEAATYPVAYCTAYHSLVNCARIQTGEVLLIHGGVQHQAAIQIAQRYGCNVVATVDSTRDQQYLHDTYGIPSSHLLSSQSTRLAQDVVLLNNGRRIDVVLTSTMRGTADKLRDCLTPLGRFVEIQESDAFASAVNAAKIQHRTLSEKNYTSIHIDIQELMQHAVFADVFRNVSQLIETRELPLPPRLQVFKQSSIEAAFRAVHEADGTGHVVVEMASDEMVEMELAPNPKPLFDSGATYLVAGAFGGIGASITTWMVQNGAKYLILPSRSVVEGTSSNRECFVRDLRSAGATVKVPVCDIANRRQLADELGKLSTMPRIRGCIQAAMVLQDSSFTNMTAEKWNNVLAPKVAGSWNLHELLPTDLDFFIMMSSSTGIMGSFGQSNYTAGNTYQDALAAHRMRNGQRAVALAFSMVVGVGYVAQNAQVQALLRVRGMLEEVTLDDIYGLLQFCCSPERADTAHVGPQIITSLTLPADLRAMNIVAPLGSTRPLYSYLDTLPSHYDQSGQQSDHATKKLPSSLLPAAVTLTEAVLITKEAIQDQLSSLLVVSKDDIDTKKAVHKYGVDSLVAVEMKNWFAKGVGADVSTTEILGDVSIEALAEMVAARSRFVRDELKES